MHIVGSSERETSRAVEVIVTKHFQDYRLMIKDKRNIWYHMSSCTTSFYPHSIFKMKVRVTLLCGDQKTAFIPVLQELTRFPSSCFYFKVFNAIYSKYRKVETSIFNKFVVVTE